MKYGFQGHKFTLLREGLMSRSITKTEGSRKWRRAFVLDAMEIALLERWAAKSGNKPVMAKNHSRKPTKRSLRRKAAAIRAAK
jgi:hypothetical protein